MSSDSSSTHTPAIAIQFFCLFGIALLLAMLAGLYYMPIEPAWGTVITQPNEYNQSNQGVDRISDTTHQANPSFDAPSIRRVDYSFTDEHSGASITHNESGESASAGNSVERKDFGVQSLQVEQGESALHPEGSCEACDELRKKYRAGDIGALFRVSILPDLATEEQFTLTVPLDKETRGYALERCVDGKLEVSYLFSDSKFNQDMALAEVRLSGSVSDLQSPFGIVYDVTNPDEVQSDAPTRHTYAQTPDEGNDDELSLLERWGKALLFLLCGFAICAVIAVVISVAHRRKR